tara:strand:- start:18 stop:254 length:237 start_codon:yes stop_codon:yes gene_type:complete
LPSSASLAAATSLVVFVCEVGARSSCVLPRGSLLRVLPPELLLLLAVLLELRLESFVLGQQRELPGLAALLLGAAPLR